MINQTAHTVSENIYVVDLAHPVAKRCKENILQEKIVLGTTFLGQWQRRKKKISTKDVYTNLDTFLCSEFVLAHGILGNTGK